MRENDARRLSHETLEALRERAGVSDQIWVTANFKEIQLDHMRPGDPVTLAIDAYPERKIHGHVESVQPGSGTAFSLLPAQNASAVSLLSAELARRISSASAAREPADGWRAASSSPAARCI
jgi:HlyD family secretion protein